ncbi:MAG: Uncharacterized protein CEN91_157 [Candidatus Berkelbacteria bacterium Licking1014_85]|uniref:Uncharacterized protein n=1 Tax=Candidatus Berkelbacteria bacterium Licking1014_85 TaxID=2017148 RepID=A0A554LM08_9BACT|nr:MAG: Uncharacterized protein CEN91_157 [Candidatus Berkelbacteria bacterium Licking1014_85]
MASLAYVSGKIETSNGQCMVGSQIVDCPNRSLSGGQTKDGGKLDLLPSNFIADTRNDSIFFGLLIAIVVIFTILGLAKTKIFGKTLGEYLKPIWYYVVICLLIVAWQYLFGINEDNRLFLRISQWIWELAIALSVIQLVRKNGFNWGNIFFLGILYSLIIHGSKVTIRYLFYDKTLLYILDRFLYGSLLVMVIVCAIGWATILIINPKNKQI